jgi:hypothetical protein
VKIINRTASAVCLQKFHGQRGTGLQPTGSAVSLTLPFCVQSLITQNTISHSTGKGKSKHHGKHYNVPPFYAGKALQNL